MHNLSSRKCWLFINKMKSSSKRIYFAIFQLIKTDFSVNKNTTDNQNSLKNIKNNIRDN